MTFLRALKRRLAHDAYDYCICAVAVYWGSRGGRHGHVRAGWRFLPGGERMLGIIADRMFSGVSGFLLIAVPYFIFTAELMNQGGLTHKLIAFNNSLFGGFVAHFPTSIFRYRCFLPG